MKSTAVSTINYTGIVTLSQYIGSKKINIAKIHNTGGSSLFSFLASCLAGDFQIAKANRPTKIKLLSRIGSKDDGGYYYKPITESIFLRTPPDPTYKAGESRVRFSFIVPREFLESLEPIDGGVLGIGLYANSVPDNDEAEAKNFMAFCLIDELDQGALLNTFLVVDWDLVISNSAGS